MSASPAHPSRAQRSWFDLIARRPVRVLVIQRDNIGDLVLVTPFLKVLRSCLADARIDALVNSYNSAVLDRNPDVDHTFVYVKAKHRSTGHSLTRLYWERARLWLALRRVRYDLAVLMTGRFSASSLRPALVAGAPHIAGYSDRSARARQLDLGVLEDELRDSHVVLRSAALLEAIVPAKRLQAHWLGVMPPCLVVADVELRDRLESRVLAALAERPTRLIAIHISARKVDQRWPAEQFVDLMARLSALWPCAFLLLWAPGSAANPLHPGDDEKAREILALGRSLPIAPCPTETLPELIAALSLAQLVVCSDGGAMHLAAGQGCPIVALFGDSDPATWRPWGPPHRILRDPSQKVAAIGVESVVMACAELLGATRDPVRDRAPAP